jgi:hypothetical protein
MYVTSREKKKKKKKKKGLELIKWGLAMSPWNLIVGFTTN